MTSSVSYRTSVTLRVIVPTTTVTTPDDGSRQHLSDKSAVPFTSLRIVPSSFDIGARAVVYGKWQDAVSDDRNRASAGRQRRSEMLCGCKVMFPFCLTKTL
eukprot:3233968-Rhodomonas_salina.1